MTKWKDTPDLMAKADGNAYKFRKLTSVQFGIVVLPTKLFNAKIAQHSVQL